MTEENENGQVELESQSDLNVISTTINENEEKQKSTDAMIKAQSVSIATTVDNDSGDDNNNDNDNNNNDNDNDNDNPNNDGTMVDIQDISSKIRKFSNVECVCYFLFLVVFTLMAVFGRTDGDYNYTQTESIRAKITTEDLFEPWNAVGEKPFDDIGNIEDIYLYIDQILFPVIFNEYYTNGTKISDPLKRYYINGQSRVLGGVRFRQSRLKVDKCEIHPSLFPRCYDDGSELTSEFVGNGHWSSNPFEYQSSTKMDDQTWRGKYGSYSGGGYVVDFLLNDGYDNATKTLNELRNGEWIDSGTLVLFIDWNAFNPSTSLHTVSRLAFEMPTGGVFPIDEIKTWKFERYAGDNGVALSVLHVMFLGFIVGFTIWMGYDMYNEGILSCQKGQSYWRFTKWRYLDVVNMIIFYALIGVFISNDYYMQNNINLTSIDEYHSFRSLQYTFLIEVYLQAINGFLLFLKLFKYLGVNKRLKFLFTMFAESAQDLFMFFVVLCIFFCAFGMAGFLTFSSDVDDYRSFVFSFSNMARYTVTEMDYTTLSSSSRLWGSAYYFAWSLLMLLVLANVFIAILSEAYGKVSETFEPGSKLGTGFFGIRRAFTKVGDVIKSLGTVVRHEDIDADGDGQVSADELAKKYNISVEKAKEYISQFDTDGDGRLNVEEFKEVIEQQKREQELELQAQQLNLSPRSRALSQNTGVSTKEFEIMKAQMNEIQQLLRVVLQQTGSGKKALKQFDRHNGMDSSAGLARTSTHDTSTR